MNKGMNKGMVTYKNGNYTVMLDLSNGTKIRYNNEDELIATRPESIDVTISKRCVNGCEFCYEGCTPEGEHADIMNAKFIDSIPLYTEIALNGNDPLHPDLVPFLEKCKEKDIIPSLTVHQNTFMGNVGFLKELCDKKLVYGLGVSLSAATEEFIAATQEFPNLVIHVVNGIVSLTDIVSLSNHGLKILVLGYKMHGRGKEFYAEYNDKVKMHLTNMYQMLPDVIERGWFDVVSFDNLAIEQLHARRLMGEKEWSRFYMGDDGSATFYIDAVEGKFAKSSVSEEQYDMTDDIIEMFKAVRG